MIKGCTMPTVMDEIDGISAVPPGFVSLKSFTLQRVQDRVLTSTPANDTKKSKIDDESVAADIVKLRKSLRHRPWVNYCQMDNSSDEEESELSDQDSPSVSCLPKGVVRGCTECGNCQKIVARWRPEGSRRPILDEAPVFYPSEEEFKDTLKYIASIRPKAEPYGICRIVPPPSWKPSCPLKEQCIWEGSIFTTRIQRLDKLQNRDTTKKLSTNHGTLKKKRRRLEKMREACRESNSDIPEILETGLYSQRFGFAQGPDFSLQSFQKYADYFKEQYFCYSSKPWEPSIENIEGEYWRIVECPTEEIEVLYGADLETGVFGSGFHKASSSRLDSNSADWAKSSWNLNNVPRLPGSVLAFENGEISGVVVPWLYAGMCFSSFCWHVEDHHLYSVNYLHWGAPKIWYGVPGREALNLEAAMKKHLADLFEEQPNLLHNLVTQFSPSILKSESVPVFRCIQQPGEFVLTFPRAYHSGFNCGFNCAEAVNIAPVDWLPHGQNAVELYREQMRKITVSHDKLLLGAAREAVRALWNCLFLKKDTPENRVWKETSGPDGILAKSLKARVELERARREYLCFSQIKKMEPSFDIESERECILCHYDLHFSAAGCPCSPDKYSCLIHAKHLCSCDWKTRFFLFRYEISELNTLVDAVGGKLSAVHKWGLQDLNLSLSSYINKDKPTQAKGIVKVSTGQDFSVSSKNTNSAQDAASLQEPIVVSKAITKMLAVGSTSVISSPTTLCQLTKSPVSSANEVGQHDNSLLKVSCALNLKTTEVDESSKNTQTMQNSRETNEQGKGESSGNHSSNSHSPRVSIPLGESKHSMCVNVSMTRHVLDSLEAEEAGERGTTSCRSDQKQRSGSSNSDESNKAGKANESDSSTSMKDNGEFAETCSSITLNTIHRQSHMQKGPRLAKVVRRINCNVELLECGTVVSGILWCTNRAIFPKGYKSRVRYWSVLNPTQMSYYVSEILDADLLGPIFMIKLEQSPTEVFLHVCATKCWNMVRERVNNEIRRLHNLGRVNLPSLQPPGSVDGLEMFGFTSPTIIQAIEAIDRSHVCSNYWSSRPKPSNPSDCGDQSAVFINAEKKGPTPSISEGSHTKLLNLFKKASSDELHALYATLSGDQSNTIPQLLDLIREENHSRLGV